ncbi:hypothetical protein HPS57_01480 [Prevotella sp. PINT]|uniref:hypothetical protein n=1 Tax=Palleniella intestinalis TaxID=2736291 RepID=UPI0015566F3C|nr:hypothetical protein [Palleniella intestinalis]NPD80658.1 hypothetical protein [Palleniella intestinalis]
MLTTMLPKEPMDIRPLLLFLSIILSFAHSLAQDNITFECNAPRDGDRLRKLQIDVISHGDRGKDAVWEVIQADEGKDYTQEFFAKGDSIVCQEHNTNYYYMICGDSLFLTGFQNRTTKMDYVKPALYRTKAMAYSDSISSEFMARGKYCDKLHIGMWGKNYVVADATGIIINGEDTLRNILRLHRRMEFRRISDTKHLPDTMFTDAYLRQCIDSLPYDNVCEDRYLWYKLGYRYPVMETVVTSHVQNDSIHSGIATSFLYLPEEQRSDLNTDLANEKVRKQLRLRDEAASGRKPRDSFRDMAHDSSHGEAYDDFPVILNAALTNDNRRLNLTYKQTVPGKLQLIVCDTTGRPIGSASYIRDIGCHTESITITSVPVDHIVVISLEINGQQSSNKITLKQ